MTWWSAICVYRHYLYFFVGVYALTIVATGVGYLGGYTASVAAIGMLLGSGWNKKCRPRICAVK